MVVLGYDPGGDSTGWGLLSVTTGPGLPVTAVYLDAGEVASTWAAAEDLYVYLAREARLPHVVAVEKVEGVAYSSKGGAAVSAHLIAAAWSGGVLQGHAQSRGARVVELPAVRWRRTVLGKPNAGDKQIAATLPRLIRDFPKVSNPHKRDALGCALAAAWIVGGR